MKHKAFSFWLLLLATCLLTQSCSRDEVGGEWLIPRDEVRDGGPGKDGIPSVDNPNFGDASLATFMEDDDLVVGFAVGDVIRAYPHPILDWHEIVNDEVNGVPIALTYCPLTGTGIAWDREIDGEVTTFGVSGLLYESNLIPYDRKTESNWSQMRLDCVNGSLIGQKAETHPVVEMTWKTWKEMYPDAEVMTEETGFNRSYGVYPYGDYISNDKYLVFPVATEDKRLPNKERVHGVVVNGVAKAYRFESFSQTGAGEVVMIEDNVNGEDVIVVGSENAGWIVSYLAPSANLQIVQDSAAVVMADDLGNSYDVFGRIVDGPDVGGRLTATESFMGYWFAWGTFYPGLEIY